MSIKFTQGRNNDRVFGKIEDIENLTKKGLRQGMFRTGKTLMSALNQEILSGPKTGRTYIRKDAAGRRRRHVASAAGESHANSSGALRKSRSFQLRGSSEIEFGYGVSSGKTAPEYAGHVEFGTSKMKARPSIKNTLNSQQGNMTQHFSRDILEKLK